MMRRPSHTGQHGGFDWIVGPSEGDLFIQRAFLRVCQRAATRKRRVSPVEHATSFARTVSEAMRRISPSSDQVAGSGWWRKALSFAGGQATGFARYNLTSGALSTRWTGRFPYLCRGHLLATLSRRGRMSNRRKKHELRVAAIAMAAANSNGRAVVGRLSGGSRDSFSELLPNVLCSPVALAL